MKLIRFYNRLKNQYKIHRRWATLWFIVKMSWIQSKYEKTVSIVGDRSVIPIIDIDIDKTFDDTINDA